jgi:transcriptional regulator with XRE-family HTH domain
MADPLLTGEQVRRIRVEVLQLSQADLALRLGYTSKLRRQAISKIETGLAGIDYLRANLLMAMEAGYQPFGYREEGLTRRQAEALWAARETGRADRLKTTERGSGGGFRRMLAMLKKTGLLTDTLGITKAGDILLDGYLSHHKVNPQLKGQRVAK